MGGGRSGGRAADERVPAEAQAAAGPINYSCGPRQYLERGTGVAVTPHNGPFAYLVKSTNRPYHGRNLFWVHGGQLRKGDKISLDWGDGYGHGYHACHATARSGGAHTLAVDQPGGRWFRACVKTRNKWTCTKWFGIA